MKTWTNTLTLAAMAATLTLAGYTEDGLADVAAPAEEELN